MERNEIAKGKPTLIGSDIHDAGRVALGAFRPRNTNLPHDVVVDPVPSRFYFTFTQKQQDPTTNSFPDSPDNSLDSDGGVLERSLPDNLRQILRAVREVRHLDRRFDRPRSPLAPVSTRILSQSSTH